MHHSLIHILFVEDNANVVRAVKLMLEMKGFRVDVARSVEEALGHIAAEDYDLLISDLSLPDGTGHDILERSGTTVPAIVLTGHTSETSRDESLKSGFAEFLTKPFKVEELIEAIQRVIPN